MKTIHQLFIVILLACAASAGAQTPQIFQEFNPWTGNLSPDGIWRKNGVWVATGGNTFDPVRCILTDTYPGQTSSGFLTLRSLANSLNGAEIQTLPQYRYGYYETRMKVTGVGDPPNNRGVCASFFIVDYSTSGWEVDIEFLTSDAWITSPNSGEVTFNWHLPNGGGSSVHFHSLPFNPKNDFHRYGILWQPGRLDWVVDGVIFYTQLNAGFTHQYGAYIMMNSWTGDANWSGLAPTQNADTVYDWVKFWPDVTSVPGSGSPPAAPSGLTATAVSSSQINLSWTASSGATSYNVKRATVSGGPYTTVATGVTATSFSDTGLAAATTYYYVVSAVNGGGESANSTQASAMTQAASPPSAPGNLTATSPSKKKITLNWTDNSNNEDGFKIERSTDGVNFTQITTMAANTARYTNTGLTSGTTYYYRVRAYNASGNSPYSNTASATAR
jgi:beta-glucanase (GH16 family)